jgi:hypothetical protein
VRPVAERWTSRRRGESRNGRKTSKKGSERFRFVVSDKSSRWDVFTAAVNDAKVSGSLVNLFYRGGQFPLSVADAPATYILEEQLPQNPVSLQILRYRQEPAVPDRVRVKAYFRNLVLSPHRRRKELEQYNTSIVG